MFQIWKTVFVLVLISVVYVAGYERDYKNYKLYELEGPKRDLHKVISFITNADALAAYELTAHKAQVLLRPDLVQRFESVINRTRLRLVELISDFSLVLAKERKLTLKTKPFSWYAYYDVMDINQFMIDISHKFPDWTKIVAAGKTYEGRDILGLRISTNVSSKGKTPKPVVFIESGIHAREWIAPATTTYFINELLTNKNPNMTSLRDSFEWHIFPLFNPDGYHYSFTVDRMWRKTRSKFKGTDCYGVDANRNWDYNFGAYGASSDPCNYQIYAGPKPFSEIETRSMSRYILKIRNLLAYISFHSFAWCILVPYSDSKKKVRNYTKLVKIAYSASDYAYLRNGHAYKNIGTAAEVMHAVSGASFDWVFQKINPPLCFTIELRGNSFLWPASRIPEMGEEVTAILIGLFEEARNLGYYKERK